MKPMLAHTFTGQELEYPVYVQPKLDGVRAIYNYNTGKFTSRNTLPIGVGAVDIMRELKDASWPDGHLNLDGELYAHKQLFQDNAKLAHSNDAKLNYNVYDYIPKDFKETFMVRFKKITRFFQANPQFTKVKRVKAYEVNNYDEVWARHDKFKAEGYEGAIVRNPKGLYQLDKRSHDLLKVKSFKDAEFKVVGHKKAKNGLILWVCETSRGRTFTVKPMSSDTDATRVNNGQKKADSYIGRMYTVKFFELTKDGIPRFGTGKGFRSKADLPEPETRHIHISPTRSPKKAKRSPKRPKKSPKRSPKRSPKKTKRSPKPAKQSPPRKKARTSGLPVPSASGIRGQCVVQTASKYTSRPSPPYPATACCEQTKKGNDGNMYYAMKMQNGSECRWVRA